MRAGTGYVVVATLEDGDPEVVGPFPTQDRAAREAADLEDAAQLAGVAPQWTFEVRAMFSTAEFVDDVLHYGEVAAANAAMPSARQVVNGQ